MGGERVLCSKHRTADHDARQDDVPEEIVVADVVAKLPEPVIAMSDNSNKKPKLWAALCSGLTSFCCEKAAAKKLVIPAMRVAFCLKEISKSNHLHDANILKIHTDLTAPFRLALTTCEQKATARHWLLVSFFTLLKADSSEGLHFHFLSAYAHTCCPWRRWRVRWPEESASSCLECWSRTCAAAALRPSTSS